jgi:hypothetical protein
MKHCGAAELLEDLDAFGFCAGISCCWKPETSSRATKVPKVTAALQGC